MGIVILSTNLHSASRVERISSSFNAHQKVIHWSVDLEDRDNVMRIVAQEGFAEQDAIALIGANGFIGKDLDC
ncbi:MAG: hypothetical protein COA38_21100 [Fluviicola sp.]|nr:MAG: hypothetical protein COA38_21100 [Fluviicola sp.]